MNILHPPRLNPKETNTIDQSKMETSISIFEQIVKDNTNVANLLAYSLHQLSVEEWRKVFLAQFAREPNEDEKNIFMIGEITPTRMAAYQVQAENILNRHKTGNQVYVAKPNLNQSINDLSASNNSIESPWVRGTRAALRLPPETNLKTLGKCILILFVLVGLLAIGVNYAKAKFF